jgi:hypothetical protein
MISIEMHTTFLDTLLITTYFITFLMQRLVGVAPLRHSRLAEAMFNSIFSLVIYFSD